VKRAMITVLGAIAGFIEGVVFFVIINFSLDAPFRVFVSGEWMDYPLLIFAGVGAICGAVMGWAACAWMSKPRTYVSVPRRPSKAGDLPDNGPFG
jgi:hypothetical protein